MVSSYRGHWDAGWQAAGRRNTLALRKPKEREFVALFCKRHVNLDFAVTKVLSYVSTRTLFCRTLTSLWRK